MSAREASEFDELVAEADAAPIVGWDFSWLDGRATEARPSWGYSRLVAARLAGVGALLDIQTGGGFLRLVVWIVPGFTVERYRAELRALHDRIRVDGRFVATSHRFLIEARKPE